MAEATVGLLRVVLASNSAQFDAGMDKSGAKVDAFGAAGKRAAASLSKMVNDFNGSKIINDAEKIATALQHVEGGAKLTEAEMRRVNAVVSEAINKYQALGQQAPPHLLKLQAETAKVETASAKLKTEVAAIGTASGNAAKGGLSQFSGALGTISRLLPALGIAASIAGIVRLGSAAVDDAGSLIDMSNATGLSTDSLQEMRAVANQTGTTLEAFTGTAFKLGVNISAGSAKARDAIRDLKLEYDALKASSPDEQFRKVVTALEGVDNAQERNRLGTALFGKQFKEIAASIEDGYGKIADAAGKSSRAQLEALDKAGDKWAAFKTEFQRSYQGMLGTLVQGIQDIERAADSLSIAQKLSLFVRGGGGPGTYLNELKGMGVALRETEEAQRKAAAAAKGAAKVIAEDYTATLRAAKAEVSGLSTIQRTQLTAALELGGDAAQEYARSIKLSDEALRLYSSSAKTGAKDSTALADAQKALFGIDTIARADLLVTALGDISNVSKLTIEKKEELNKAVLAALDAYRALGQQAPANLHKILAATTPLLEVTRNLGAAVKTAGGMVFPMPRGVEDSSKEIGEIRESMEAMEDISFNQTWVPFIQGANASEAGVKRVAAGAETLTAKYKRLGAEFSSVIIGTAMGGGDIGKAVGAWGGQKLGEAAGEKIAKAMGGKIGSMLGGMAGPIGAALGSLAGSAIGKLFGGVSKEVLEARKSVDAFQASLAKTLTITQRQEAGNEKWKMTVIAVRDAYLATGRTAAEAEAIVKQLWNTSKPEAAAAAMDKINAVLKEQADLLEANKTAASTLFDDIMTAGSEGIPAAYRPAIEQLIALGLLTDEQAAKLRGLGDSGAVNIDKMESAMGVLHGRIESLGPAFRQAKINETAMEYANAIQTLIDGGGDVGGILFDAREELGGLVEDSLAAGTTLPANLKPWIDDLVRSGNLIDKNGNKITDVSNLKYGEAMKTEGEKARDIWTAILDKITALVDKITGPLTDSINNIPDRTIRIGADTSDLDRALEREGQYRSPSGNREDSGFATGTMGRLGKWFGDFGPGKGIFAHGMEAIVTPKQAVPFALDTLSGLIPDIRMPSMSPAFAGMGGSTTTNSHSTNYIIVPMPSDAVGDVYRMTRAVINAVPSSIEINEGGIRNAIESVYDDRRRTYGR